MLRVVSAPPFGICLRNVLPCIRVSVRVEQVRELLEFRGSARGIASAVRLHGIFVSDNPGLFRLRNFDCKSLIAKIHRIHRTQLRL
jgi:hypothetical protein